MTPALTTAGIGNPGGFEPFVSLAARHGFHAIDTGGDALLKLIEAKGESGARQWLQEQNVAIASIGLPVEWRKDEATFLAGLPRLAAHAHAASLLGCTRCCTWMLPSVDDPVAPFTARAVRRLRTCAEILGKFGLRFGIEFVGPMHLRTRTPNLFVYDIPGTMELIGAIGLPNVGLLLDTYHWHTTGSRAEDITALPASAIVHVHVNDAKPLPVEQLLDNDRLFPGEGVIDFARFLGALRQIGYDGFLSLEVLTQTPPPGTPDEMAAKARRAFDQVLAGFSTPASA